MLIYLMTGVIAVAVVLIVVLILKATDAGNPGKSIRAGRSEVTVQGGVDIRTGRLGSAKENILMEADDGATFVVNTSDQNRWHIRFINMGTGEQYQFSFFGRISIGRSESETVQETKLVLSADRLVSKTHCHISDMNGCLVISDAGSRNHTYVNGKRLGKAVALSQNDEITVGGTKLKICFTRG